MDVEFFACVPVKMLKLPDGFTLSLEEQKSMIHKVFGHPLYQQHPPPISYQLHFLKWYISQAEAQGQEVCDDLYELYGSLISQPNTHSEHCFKSYQIPCQGEERYITLKESTNIISAGTTGLTTWQAAYYFVEWAVENRHHFNQKHVLELGSGVGLVGLAVCSSCAPSSYCFSDCHPQVLRLLSHNIHLNLSADMDTTGGEKGGGCGADVSMQEVDWSASTETILSSLPQPLDCILATDVVYDNEVIDLFVHVLTVLLSHWPRAVAYVTSTVRNEDTYQHFCSKLDASHVHITREKMPAPTQRLFYYDRTQKYEILKLHLTPQS